MTRFLPSLVMPGSLVVAFAIGLLLAAPAGAIVVGWACGVAGTLVLIGFLRARAV